MQNYFNFYIDDKKLEITIRKDRLYENQENFVRDIDIVLSKLGFWGANRQINFGFTVVEGEVEEWDDIFPEIDFLRFLKMVDTVPGYAKVVDKLGVEFIGSSNSNVEDTARIYIRGSELRIHSEKFYSNFILHGELRKLLLEDPKNPSVKGEIVFLNSFLQEKEGVINPIALVGKKVKDSIVSYVKKIYKGSDGEEKLEELSFNYIYTSYFIRNPSIEVNLKKTLFVHWLKNIEVWNNFNQATYYEFKVKDQLKLLNPIFQDPNLWKSLIELKILTGKDSVINLFNLLKESHFKAFNDVSLTRNFIKKLLKIFGDNKLLSSENGKLNEFSLAVINFAQTEEVPLEFINKVLESNNLPCDWTVISND
ncbi:MAG: hypothetical protein QE271_14180 [Bacteriovoracaceae bacterium]|nr:hypothetical protein [Bacteriovoracaceae bacterium]